MSLACTPTATMGGDRQARGIEIKFRRCASCGGSPTFQVEDPSGRARTLCHACLENGMAELPDNGAVLHIHCSVEDCGASPGFFVREASMQRWSGALCRDHLVSFSGSIEMVLALPEEVVTRALPIREIEVLRRWLPIYMAIPEPSGLGELNAEDQ